MLRLSDSEYVRGFTPTLISVGDCQFQFDSFGSCRNIFDFPVDSRHDKAFAAGNLIIGGGMVDFVTKKAFEAKLKKIGNDIGLTDALGGGSSSNANNDWTGFPSSGMGEGLGQAGNRSENDESPFPVPLATYFDGKAKNFPPLIHLFYIDRTILSDRASNGVKWALYNLILVEVMLLVNMGCAILFNILKSDSRWIYIVLSGAIGLLLTLFELLAYETAFRGAYRTNNGIQQRYMVFCAVNLVLAGLYAFIGTAWFNGWTRISGINSGSIQSGTLRMVFTIIEAFGWSVALFVSMFTLFEYYHIWHGKHQGLSVEASRLARSGIHGEEVRERPETRTSDRVQQQESHGGNRGDSRQDRLDQIRNKYMPSAHVQSNT